MYINRNIQKNAALFIFLFSSLLFTRLYALFKVGRSFYNFEGLWRGWMAKEMLEGAGWSSIFNNPYLSAEGGSAVIGYTAALFFTIFGDSFFSLIFVSIVFSLLIWTTFYLFLIKHFSRSTAIIFSFLFIFAPPDFFLFSLRAIGAHFEAILFSALGLFCFFEIFFNEANYNIYIEKRLSKKVNLLFFILGLISGFGIYFYYTYLIFIFTIILFWFVIDKRFFLKRHFYVFLFGFTIGFLPWLIYNITHNFDGLKIHGLSLFEVVFSKNGKQIFQTFVYIVIHALTKFLGIKLYLTIVFSFIFLTFLNLKSFKYLFLPIAYYVDRIKEIIIIIYVIVFILTWSVLYMPIGFEKSIISGLPNRLYYIYPFLFILIALCLNRLLLLRQNGKYLLKVSSIAMTAWIIGIGSLNYSELLIRNSKGILESENNIRPLKIKGYSIRIDFLRRNKELAMGFLSRDVVSVATERDSGQKLNKFFIHADRFNVFNADKEFLQKLADDLRFDAAKILYFFVLMGLNTGDLMEDYDISGLNQFIIQRVPDKYRHYFYEGLSIALMDRRHNELMKNIGFIDMVPIEYRHYFLFGLGRLIGTHFEGKIREERLEYAIKRFSPIFEDYIYHGLIAGLICEEFLKDPEENIKTIKEKYLPYLYRTIAVYSFDNVPLENDVSSCLKKFGINKDNEKYFYYGAVEAFFKNDNSYREKDVKTKIEKIIACNYARKDYLYEGLGLTLGHLTFGYINRYAEFIEPLLNNDELAEFYKGYCLSLKERYGRDIGKIKELIEDNVGEKFRENL